jgi:hypothetical protein
VPPGLFGRKGWLLNNLIAASDGDGGLATRSAVWPGNVTVDSHGNVLIADAFNNRIRVVPAVTGTYYGQAMKEAHMYSIITGSGVFAYVGQAIAIDGYGNVIFDSAHYVQAAATTSGTFYGQVMQADTIYTIAGAGFLNEPESGADGLGDGGPATKAVLDFAGPMAIAPDGDIYVADQWAGRVRQITA